MADDEPPRTPEIPPEVPLPPRPAPPNWPVPDAPQPSTRRMPVLVEPLVATLEERLLERRIVAVTGALDAERVTDLAARLLHLDALSVAPVTVHLDSPGGDVGAALVLVDTLGAMRAPVHVVLVGQAVGAAVAVLAAGDERSMYPHARVVLTEPELPTIQGDAGHVASEVAEHRRLLDAAYDVIAQRCGRSRADVARDAQRRLLMTADDAVAYGLVERVAGSPERR